MIFFISSNLIYFFLVCICNGAKLCLSLLLQVLSTARSCGLLSLCISFLGLVWWIGITVIVEGSQKKVKFNNINYYVSWDSVGIF